MSVQDSTIQLLQDTGALLEGHFILTSDRHSDKYINKDAVTMWPLAVGRLCEDIAAEHVGSRIQVVAAPAVGGIALGQWTAYHLSKLGPFGSRVQSVYAERVEERLVKAEHPLLVDGFHARLYGDDYDRTTRQRLEAKLETGDELIVRRGNFEFKRGYGPAIKDKRVLVVEDILTTGASVAKVVQAVREAGGIVVATAALANRGGVKSEDIDSELSALAEVTFDSWQDETVCPLCTAGVPINTEVGKGKLFIAGRG